jgi:isocitrate dehydrogenase kinase/phosphatase
VQYLRSMMPRKPRNEIYNALGLAKQGKTLFYRDFLHHLAPFQRQISHRARHQGHGDAGV